MSYLFAEKYSPFWLVVLCILKKNRNRYTPTDGLDDSKYVLPLTGNSSWGASQETINAFPHPQFPLLYDVNRQWYTREVLALIYWLYPELTEQFSFAHNVSTIDNIYWLEKKKKIRKKKKLTIIWTVSPITFFSHISLPFHSPLQEKSQACR